MSIEAADAVAAPLKPEIETALSQADTLRKQVRHKQIGLSYIQSCKDLATDANGTVDTVVLKEAILSAVVLLQSYHDALSS